MAVRWQNRAPLLYLVCALLPAAEAAGLYLAGFTSALPLAPQVVAPGPFGAYHDLRWLFTFSASWPDLVWQLAALLAFRTALTVLLAVLAWPADAPRPGLGRLAARSAAQAAIAVAALSPWAALSFASSAVSYSWFMLGSIVAAGATALVLPAAAADGAWWHRLPPWRAALIVLATWVALMVEACAVTYAPGGVAVLAAAASGTLNALLWQHHTAATLRGPAARRRWALAPAGVVAVLALFLLGGGHLVSSGGVGGGGGSRSTSAGPSLPAHVPLIYVAGYDSSYDGRPYQLLGATVWHFSYAGMDRDRHPVAYRPANTHQPLAASARRLAAQVEALYATSHRDVVLLADSEGSLVVRMYLERQRRPPVRMFVELSPLLRPGRVFVPAAGSSGPGLVAGWEVRGLLRITSAVGTVEASADGPFVRSVMTNAAGLRGATMCPAPGLPVFAFVPFEGALTVYGRPISRVPWTAVPGYHATLLGDSTVQHDVAVLVRSGRLPKHAKSTAAFPLISAAAAAWQVPALPLDAPGHHDPAFAPWSCPPS